MPQIGPLEVVIVLVIALLVFGPKKLPEMGRSMGKGIREFKSSVSGDDRDDDHEHEPVRRAQELPPAAPPAPAERVTTPSGSTSTLASASSTRTATLSGRVAACATTRQKMRSVCS